MNMSDPSQFLHDLFGAALSAADPLQCLPPCLLTRPKGRVIVIGAGKASGAMAKAVENTWTDVAIEGVVVTQYGYAMPTDKIEIIEAAHPVPDNAGEQACTKIMQLLSDVTKDDLVLCLISGGGSSLLCAPAPCLSSVEKQAINKALLKSGAPIAEMNCVRKHLSNIKGGRLAVAAYPAQIRTLVVSDVPGDEAHIVASGPTLPDPTTQEQALEIIARYQIPVSDKIRAWLSDPSNETPKADHPAFAENNHPPQIIARARDAMDAACKFASAHNITPIMIGDDIEGEAREIGAAQIQVALAQSKDRTNPYVILSGGETTVTVRGHGKGGRNTEYLLGALKAAKASDTALYVMACDTDGIDGSEDNAGAFFTPQILERADNAKLNPDDYLANNDAYSFFEAVDSLVVTGPTFTNVNDFRAIFVPKT